MNWCSFGHFRENVFSVVIKVRKWFRDHRQINHAPSSPPAPLFLMDDIKVDGIPNKAKSNENYLPFLHCTSSFNPIQDESFRGCSQMKEGGRAKSPPPPLSKICHTYSTLMKLATVIPYLKKIQKIYKSRDTPPWVLLTSAFFQRKSAIYSISVNTGIGCILLHKF